MAVFELKTPVLPLPKSLRHGCPSMRRQEVAWRISKDSFAGVAFFPAGLVGDEVSVIMQALEVLMILP